MGKLLAISACLILLSACEDRRTFEPRDFERGIVVNAIVSPDTDWATQISYTKSIFDPSDFSIVEDAKVRIADLTSGQSFFLELKEDGHYRRSLKPASGHEYLVSVKIDGEEEIRAYSYIPSVPEVNVNTVVKGEVGEQSIEIDIEITDNPEEENYYVWELLEVSEDHYLSQGNGNSIPNEQEDPGKENDEGQHSDGGSGDPEDPIQQEYESEPDDSLEPESIYSFDNLEAEGEYQKKEINTPSFLSDSDVKSGKIANRLILDASFISKFETAIGRNDENPDNTNIPLFELKVMAVSPDLFEYLKSYESYKQSEIKNTSISDPVLVHSNIENGLGIFGGFSMKSFYIYP